MLDLVVIGFEVRDGIAELIVGTTIERFEPRVVDVIKLLAEGDIRKSVQVPRRISTSAGRLVQAES